MNLLQSIESTIATPTLVAILSGAVGVTFAYAAIAKATSFTSLVSEIGGYEFIPVRFARPAAGLLIACECVISFSHLSGKALQVIAPATLLLLAIFFLVTVVILARGQVRPCLCFGASRDDHVDGFSLLRLSLIVLCEGILASQFFALEDRLSVGRNVLGEPFVVLVGALTAALVGWILSLPKLWRVWKVLDI